MSTRLRIFLAVGLFALPILVRFVVFYQFPYFNNNISQPDYASYQVPEPPTPSSKPAAVAKVEDGKVVVIDVYHGNQFGPSEIEPLTTALSARGARVEYDDGARSLDSQLKYASAYVIFSPSITFTGEELHAVQQFVENGGRLLVFTDPTRATYSYNDDTGETLALPDVNYANPVLAPFGLDFVNDYLYNLQDNEGNFRNVKLTDFAKSPLTEKLNMVVFYGAHSVETNAGTMLALGDAHTLSSVTDQGGSLAPIALSANGQVLALGDFSFLTSPFTQVADNQVLLGAIADFAVAAQRLPSLENFPYVFQNQVSLVTTGDVKLSASLIGPLSGLQAVLKMVNVPLVMSETAPRKGNTIVLGTLAPSDDLVPYVRPFGIDLETIRDVVEIKGLGKFTAADTGLMLFSQNADSATLVLLAPSSDTLPELIDLASAGDLSSCVIQANVGVCALKSVQASDSTYSDSYYGTDSYYSDYGSETPTPDTPEATPVPTATPAG